MNKKISSLLLVFLILISALLIYHYVPNKKQKVSGPQMAIPPADYLQDILVQSPEGRKLVEENNISLDHRVIYWVREDYPNFTVTRAEAIFWVGGKWVTTQVSSSEYRRRYIGGEPYIIKFDVLNNRVLSIEKADKKKLQEYWDTYYQHCNICNNNTSYNVIVIISENKE